MCYKMIVNNKYYITNVEEKEDGSYYIAYPTEKDIKLIAQYEEKDTVIEIVPTDTKHLWGKIYGRFSFVDIDWMGGISFRIQHGLEVGLTYNGEIKWNFINK